MPPAPAPATLAAVELITRAVEAGHTALALAIFKDHPPAERDRIAALIRRKLLRPVARSRRV